MHCAARGCRAESCARCEASKTPWCTVTRRARAAAAVVLCLQLLACLKSTVRARNWGLSESIARASTQQRHLCTCLSHTHATLDMSADHASYLLVTSCRALTAAPLQVCCSSCGAAALHRSKLFAALQAAIDVVRARSGTWRGHGSASSPLARRL